MLQHPLMVIGAVFLLLACVYDWALRVVPNAIPLVVASAGIALRWLSGNLAAGLLAAAIVFVLAALCWRRGWLGGADVKLLGAGALLVAPASACGFALATCLAGGVLAIVYLLLGRLVPPPGPRPTSPSLVRRIIRIEQRRLQRRGPLPYATAIAAGACATLIGR